MTPPQPLHLCLEIPWSGSATPPSASNGPDGRLPYASRALTEVLFPHGAGSGPDSVAALQERIRDAERADGVPEAHHVLSPPPLADESTERLPSPLGVLYAARYLAFRRAARATEACDVAVALACAGAEDFVPTTDRARSKPDQTDADIAFLIAHFGHAICSSALGTVVPQLARLVALEERDHRRLLLDARWLTQQALRDVVPSLLLQRTLALADLPIATRDTLKGRSIETVREFLRRVFRETLNTHEATIKKWLDQLQTYTEIDNEAEPDIFAEERALAAELPSIPTLTTRERTERGRATMNRLLPSQPKLRDLLLGKAMLLGSGVPPTAVLLSGGTAEARRVLLRELARATGAAFACTHAARMLGFRDHVTCAQQLFGTVDSFVLPTDGRTPVGTIMLIEGCEILLSTADDDYGYQRIDRLNGQQALAVLLDIGPPATLYTQGWPLFPWLVVCAMSPDGDLRPWRQGAGEAGGWIEALTAQFGDPAALADLSVGLMMEILAPVFRTPTNLAATGPDGVRDGHRLEIPLATVISAARMAHRRKGTAEDARRLLEAAARRIVLRTAEAVDESRPVVAPDDLQDEDAAG